MGMQKHKTKQNKQHVKQIIVQKIELLMGRR